ncbi:phosphopentomutase [Oceaniovalibus guishaninsula JLT2003]|uniref:Phosphopentomutase n=1 Tax=Oceaniovalibus guishaninsula JLT2003 TaxID=1231392 RepID=K2HBC1_9RHOB|nr:phosphopentomutase [Oceaniovalibus guishaninsula]EKE44768.1 phosphopentomutase [Oceaniovalibus guishaninsula JLT2003]
MSRRAFLIVLDSVGIGGAPDAASFGDEGADTVGHIRKATGVRLSNLDALGLAAAQKLAKGEAAEAPGMWGAATEVSRGKDTPSGHWELAGVPVPWDWHYFPQVEGCFPAELVARIRDLAGTDGILGNRPASGTAIIDAEGARHIETGWPIVYTSTDSVVQIAAHEDAFGLDRLLTLCARLAPDLHAMKVGRVIARPFVGQPGDFRRTPRRRDYAIAPPAPTLCDWVQAAGGRVNAVGKIGDIFSMRGIDRVDKGTDAELLDHLAARLDDAPGGSLTFANFVEFDSEYGHRRDPQGYARHLQWFDAALPRLLGAMRDGDMLVVTADHGNDPTFRGTDHTRERVPVLVAGLGDGALGHVAFADVGASVAAHLGVAGDGPGRSFL